MVLKKSSKSNYPIGVIGAGSFGTVIANLLAKNKPVLLFTRDKGVCEKINSRHQHLNRKIHSNVQAIFNLSEVGEKCKLIFPCIPSSGFREMIKNLSPFLHPDHIIIHTTKGLDVQKVTDIKNVDKSRIKTMSEVIAEESVVIRIGCLAGPNLASEIAEGQPAATVIASKFDEVVREGRKALRSRLFQVYSSPDIIGAELSGSLKNTIAIASGMLSGLGFGENAKAYLITKGWGEMIRIGTTLGSDMKAFMGLAGIGDLIATCSSQLSRNFTVGYGIAKGKTLHTVLAGMTEVAEGVNTVKITHFLARNHKIRTPINDMLYRILFENLNVSKGLDYLMKYPFSIDVDFL